MSLVEGEIARLATALGIGLLMGVERERRKGVGATRAPGGVRTFAIASLLGAVSSRVGGVPALAVSLLAVGCLCGVAYYYSRLKDPGMTTEIALLLAVLLGAFAQQSPVVASGLAVVVTILLAARGRLHHFVRAVVSEEDLHDALLFAAIALVLLPLLPDRYVGPFQAINPRTIGVIVILVMSISAAGYIAVRMLGARFGLPIAGFTSGFVSSSATIGAMGARVRDQPTLARPAVAGAVLSTVATIVQMTAVLAATSPAVLMAMAAPLVASAAVALAYGWVFTWRSMGTSTSGAPEIGRAFSLKSAVLFTATITVLLFAAAALNAGLGNAGVLVAAAVAGFADTHAAAASIASLVAAGKLSPADATIPILAALSTNTVSKIVLAIATGGRSYALQIIPGLLLVLAVAWLGLFVP